MWTTGWRKHGSLGYSALAPLAALPLAVSLSGEQPPNQQARQAPQAQQAQQATDKVTVSFSDPSRPGRVKVQLVTGSITVRGYDGRDVLVDIRSRDEDDEDRDSKHEGMRRIRNTGSGLTVEEENNEMRIGTSMPNREMDLTIQVPVRTSLTLSAVNDGDILVERVDGEIEVNNVNGAVTLNDVSGSVVAHALNDDLKATLRRTSGKPMSFSSLNGDIDVTLPAETKANVQLETSMGEIYSDFDIQMEPTTVKKTVEDDRAKGGKYRVEIEKGMIGRINGGGPEIKFKTFNGDIHIRRAK